MAKRSDRRISIRYVVAFVVLSVVSLPTGFVVSAIGNSANGLVIVIVGLVAAGYALWRVTTDGVDWENSDAD